MVNRYTFYQLFGYNQQTGYLYPLFNTWINGAYYERYLNIPRGLSFGGLDLYALIGHDIAATWNSPATPNAVTIAGFY